MGGPDRRKRRTVRLGKGFVTRAYLGAVLVVVATLPDPAEPTALLDWSEWDGQPAVPLSERPRYTDATSVDTLDARCLRRLVRDCSVQLEVPGRQCGDGMVESDDFRVPFFYSRPSCGFEVRVMSKGCRSSLLSAACATHPSASCRLKRFCGNLQQLGYRITERIQYQTGILKETYILVLVENILAQLFRRSGVPCQRMPLAVQT